MISFKSQPLLTGYVRRHIIRNFFKTMLKYKLKPLYWIIQYLFFKTIIEF